MKRYSPNANPSFGNITANTFSAPLDLSYEVDLWGRVRRGFESARADAQASLADFYNVLLTLQSDVAQNYFALRSLDAEIATVNGTVDLRHEQVRLVRSRFEGGIGSELDVAQAETELATTEAEAASLAHRRDELENAIAILVGENPSTFKLAAVDDPNWNPQPPEIPAGLPSDLLERRPDVAKPNVSSPPPTPRSASPRPRSFPVLTLTGSGGYLSGDLSSLFTWDIHYGHFCYAGEVYEGKHEASRSRGLSPAGWSLSLPLVPALCAYVVFTIILLSRVVVVRNGLKN